MNDIGGHGLLARALVGAALVGAASSIHASCPSNFESGSLGDWLFATTGVYGASGVESHNGSKMAYVAHTGGLGNSYGSNTTQSSLSCSMAYSADTLLSFDMHAVAVSGTATGVTAHAGAGVRIELMNIFNVAIGSAGLYNYTNPGLLGPNEYPISNTQQSFSALMGDYATLAGVNPSAPKKISLTFLTWGQFKGGGNIYPDSVGSATVDFDNVSVGAVPEPATTAMMLGGLGMLGWLRWRRAPRQVA